MSILMNIYIEVYVRSEETFQNVEIGRFSCLIVGSDERVNRNEQSIKVRLIQNAV